MSIDVFCDKLAKEISDLRAKREKLGGAQKGACTRRIKILAAAHDKATRVGIKE